MSTEERKWGGRENCHVSCWLSNGMQRQIPFSNPIFSAGSRHPTLLCNPVNMHPIPSRHRTLLHRNLHTCSTKSLSHTCHGFTSTHWAVAAHKHHRQEASCGETLSKTHTNTQESAHETPGSNECFFHSLTHLRKKQTRHYRWEINWVAGHSARIWDLLPPHPISPNCIFVHLISASTG